jgi:hypothetical protein
VSGTDGTAGNGGGYLGYTGGWGPVVALIDALEADAPNATRDLLREAHRAGLVTSFDWPTWMTGRGRELAGNPEAIASATLEECRRLLVAHLRRDRFVTDHLADVLASGEICAILRRARTITTELAASPPVAKLPLTTTSETPVVAAPATATATRPPAATPAAAARAIGPDEAERRRAATPTA